MLHLKLAGNKISQARQIDKQTDSVDDTVWMDLLKPKFNKLPYSRFSVLFRTGVRLLSIHISKESSQNFVQATMAKAVRHETSHHPSSNLKYNSSASTFNVVIIIFFLQILYKNIAATNSEKS